MTPVFISVLYFEGCLLAFTDAADVWSYRDFKWTSGGWCLEVHGPLCDGPQRFLPPEYFEGAIVAVTPQGQTWRLDLHMDTPTCDWRWTLLSSGL